MPSIHFIRFRYHLPVPFIRSTIDAIPAVCLFYVTVTHHVRLPPAILFYIHLFWNYLFYHSEDTVTGMMYRDFHSGIHSFRLEYRSDYDCSSTILFYHLPTIKCSDYLPFYILHLDTSTCHFDATSPTFVRAGGTYLVTYRGWAVLIPYHLHFLRLIVHSTFIRFVLLLFYRRHYHSVHDFWVICSRLPF